ncbi:MAG: protein kinase, partial [Deltaproteobacteria bacterium]|nr:protein kinase [Deltaproteobacteria bacterium]
MAPPPLDRTETLSPRTSSPESAPVPVTTAPALVDDPERYEQIGEHARGGLGRIVRAVDKRLGRTVAVKELLRRNDATNEARFMREALITARLEHPGIVPVHEAGRWPSGEPYYVMKLVEGRTLKELIAEPRVLRERLALLPHVIAVADAVGYAHSEGVIHRDLKPSNVVVGEFGETIVVDWGLARDRKHPCAIDDDHALAAGSPIAGSGVSTVSGKVVGTPAYMAPEQARGDLVDERADVYAIGALLYEMLSGIAPHADATPQATLDRVLAGPPRPLCETVPAIPGELATIVGKAMARDPEARYANGTALAEDLRRFQTGKLVRAHSYTALSRLRKKLSRHRGVALVAVASAVALGAIGVTSFRRVVAERNIARVERQRTEDALSNTEQRKRALVLLQAETSLRKDPTAALAWLKLALGSSTIPSEADRAKIVDVVDEAVALGVARHVFRPGDWVFDAAFSPDGATLIAAVRDGTLRSYDLRTGFETTLGRTNAPPELLLLTSDGKLAITSSQMGQVTAWPVTGGDPRTLADTGHLIKRLRLSPDDKRLRIDSEAGTPIIVALDDPTASPTPCGPKTTLRSAVADDDWTKQVVMTAWNQLAVVKGETTVPLGQVDKAITHVGLSPLGDVVEAHDGATLWSVPFAGGAMKALAKY